MQFVLTHMWQVFHIWQNQIQRDSNTNLHIVFNYIITGLTHQVTVLHIHHLKFLHLLQTGFKNMHVTELCT